MAKMNKRYVLIFDCETTQSGKIFDAAYIVLEKNAPFREVERFACILSDYCKEPLFSLNGKTGGDNHFSTASLQKRTQAYRDMLKDGRRVLCTKEHLNARLGMLHAKYNHPTFYAYNAKFDWQCLKNSGIAVDNIFKEKRCLMESAVRLLLPRSSFHRFALQNGSFTAKNFLSFSAEKVHQYITGNPDFKEAHTALEDCKIEADIYRYLARQKAKSVPMGVRIDWQSISLANVYNNLHSGV